MSVFECKTCGHLEFGGIPDLCLVCRSSKESYAMNPNALKSPANPDELSEGDKKHIPVVAVNKVDGGTEVKVTVGEIEHVMQAAHFIAYVDYYPDKTFISRVWLSPEACKPEVTLKLAVDSGTITVVENCNVHGNWATDVAL